MSLIDIEICQVTTTYARVRALIMDAKLLPNSHHGHDDLAAELQVDLDNLLAASQRLEQAGLIRADGDTSFWVLPMASGAIARVHRQLAIFEAQAVELAATNGTSPIGLRALEDAVATMEDAHYRGDYARWATADHHFHRSLVQCSGDATIISSALQLSECAHRARMMMLRLQPPPADTAHHYGDVIAAIRCGWAIEARDLHRLHWKQTSTMTLAVLEQHGLDIIRL